MKHTLLAVLLLSLVAGCFAPVAADGSEVRLRTALTGAAIGGMVPSGHAEFRSRPGRSSFVVEVQNVNLTPGTPLGVFVTQNGMESKVGTIILGPPPTLGGELDLESQNGDSVPQLSSGTLVVVKTPGGQAILSGVL